MLSRRSILQSLALLALTPLPRLTLAQGSADPRLVLVLLRGGADGLAMLPPHGDRRYAAARQAAALPSPAAADLDGFFGLHPTLSPLLPLWDARELLPIAAVGMPGQARSHFDAQDALEVGQPDAAGLRDGWLNRALQALDAAPPALAVGRDIPLVLRGEASVTSIEPTRRGRGSLAFLELATELYAADPVLAESLAAGLRTRALVDCEPRSDERGAAAEGEATGQLLAHPDGPRVAVAELSGWDTHANQAVRLDRQLGNLADALLGLQAGLGAAWSQTAIVVISEFGRTVAGNGTGGTDHGTAGTALLAGGAVAGGRVRGEWPGLADLHEGRDLALTTDVRAVLKGLLRDHLGVSEDALESRVFPGSARVAPLKGLVRR